jgi:hypothetical protein
MPSAATWEARATHSDTSLGWPVLASFLFYFFVYFLFFLPIFSLLFFIFIHVLFFYFPFIFGFIF